MKVSVIIPAYNAEQTLPLALRSLAAPPGHELEVIVVDDRSTDRTVDVARALADHVVVMEKNSGPSLARNQGARLASGEVLLFMDADVELLPDTLARILDEMVRFPECAAVAGNLAVNSHSENFIGTYKNLYMHFAFKDLRPTTGSPYTSILAVRTEAFHATGGFVNVLPNEDRLLGIALARLGYTVRFDNDIQVRHYRSYRWREFVRTEAERSRNIVRLHLETRLLHRGRMQEHIPPRFVVAALLVGCVPLLAGLAAAVHPLALVLAPAVLVAYGFLMWPFFSFLRRHQGLRFALGGALLALVDLAICSVGAAWGVAGFLLGRRLIPR
jgi:glycosyltransferase involved in cell wall biosynthesis